MRRSWTWHDAVRTGSSRTFSRMSSKRCCSRIPRTSRGSSRSGNKGPMSLRRRGVGLPARNTSMTAPTPIRRRGWSDLPATTRSATVRLLHSASGWTASGRSAVTSLGGSLGSSLFPPWGSRCRSCASPSWRKPHSTGSGRSATTSRAARTCRRDRTRCATPCAQAMQTWY